MISENPAASVAGPSGQRPASKAEAARRWSRRRGRWQERSRNVPLEQPTVFGPKPPASGGRGVAQEARDAVEDIASLEEAAEDLRVETMNPLAAEFYRVTTSDDGEVVLDLRAPERLVNIGLR